MENIESFINGLRSTNNTTIVEFKASDLVLAKFDGKFFFFEKNLSPIANSIPPRKVVNGLQSAYPSIKFVEEILLKVYKNAVTYAQYTMRIYQVDRGTPILSDKDFAAFASLRYIPQFLYYPVWVAQVDVDHIKYVLLENNLEPIVSTIRTLDNSPISEDFKAILESIKDILGKLIGRRKSNDIPIPQSELKDKLLSCEEIRCGLERYKETLLTDPKRGHWDLLNVAEKDRFGYIARDPKNDINENSVVGIDFGTKSTVVYYMDENAEVLPIPIGDAKDSKHRYENPTVLHFVSLEKFLKGYISASGRPDTEWRDLTAAHTAQRQYDGDSSIPGITEYPLTEYPILQPFIAKLSA